MAAILQQRKQQQQQQKYIYLAEYLFDGLNYLEEHPDVLQYGYVTKTHAFVHFMQSGLKEGRKFRFLHGFSLDPHFYLETYKDLGKAGITTSNQALMHYILFGFQEKRVCCQKQMDKHRKQFLDQALQPHIRNISNQRNNKEEFKINVLIRTSNRPSEFEKLMQSILQQNYANYELHICYDKHESLDYLEKYSHMQNVHHYPIAVESNEHYKYNLYCNFLLRKVTQGYILFIDDDDMFLHENVFTIINNELIENDIVFWKFLRADKLIFPEHPRQPLVLGEIANGSVCFNQRLKETSQWDNQQCSDYRFYARLFDHSTKRKFIPFIMTGTQFSEKIGNWGK